MKTEFRPIPITILDFLGVLLPGWVWLFLITATIDFISTGSASPASAWLRLVSVQKDGGSWLGPIALIFSALIAGYAFKPISMLLAQHLSKYMFKLSSNTRHCAAKNMTFPYNAYFSSKAYYHRVEAILKRVSGLESDGELPGKAPFSPAKRYLRLISANLWEESERMEAEVRMVGGLFLAGVYLSLLSCLVVIAHAASTGVFPQVKEWVWLFSAFAITALLGAGFNRTRLHEVENTYMNVLLSEGHRDRGSAAGNN